MNSILHASCELAAHTPCARFGTAQAVVALRGLLWPEAAESRVELCSLPAWRVAVISATLERGVVHEWYGAAMVELGAAVPLSLGTGPPGGRYANELFPHDAGAVMVYHPVDDLRPGGSRLSSCRRLRSLSLCIPGRTTISLRRMGVLAGGWSSTRWLLTATPIS